MEGGRDLGFLRVTAPERGWLSPGHQSQAHRAGCSGRDLLRMLGSARRGLIEMKGSGVLSEGSVCPSAQTCGCSQALLHSSPRGPQPQVASVQGEDSQAVGV